MIPKQPLIAPEDGFLASLLGCTVILWAFSAWQARCNKDTSGSSITLDVVEILVVWALEFRLQVESGRGIHAQHAL